MNNGNKRREYRRRSTSKRYRVRYDRIVASLLVLVVLIVIPTSCVKGCSKKKNKSNGDTSTSQTNNTEDSPENDTGETNDSTIIDDLKTSDETSSILNPEGSSDTTVSSFTSESHPAADVNKGDLVLVNGSHQYKFIENDIEPVTLYDHIMTDFYSVSDYVMCLDAKTIERLNAMMSDFNKATKSKEIMIIGGYRSLEDQNSRYNSGKSQFPGGFSDYNAGRSFDMGIFPDDGSSSGFYSPSGIYAWIDEHSAEYGFIVRYPDGKDKLTNEKPRTQTYRYVGAPHATYIKEKGLCLEEYIDAVKAYTNEKPLKITVGSDIYNVYYTPAGKNTDTDVPVPSDKTYSVSGNNTDGFIVTVKMN